MGRIVIATPQNNAVRQGVAGVAKYHHEICHTTTSPP